MRRFSDFATGEHPLEGDKTRLDDVLNKEVIIKDYKISKSKYEGKGNYITIQIEENGGLKIIFTGSEVLASQCEKYKEEMPFLTTIKKIDRYYTFS